MTEFGDKVLEGNVFQTVVFIPGKSGDDQYSDPWTPTQITKPESNKRGPRNLY